jgi:predicted  nucleic acid-binding Zn-ribbon protein
MPLKKAEERRVPHEDELALLREEAETLAEFLHLLQREFAQLEADLASILAAIGDHIDVPYATHQAPPLSRRIERTVDPATGTITFRLTPRAQ